MSDKKKLKNLLDQGLISEEEYTKGIRKSSNSSLIKIGVGVLAAVSVLIAVSNPSGVEDQPSLSVSEPVTESKEISPNNASSDLQPTTTISTSKAQPPSTSTTIRSIITTTTIPTVTIGGITYTCTQDYDGWTCRNGGTTYYCDAVSNYSDCSKLWYPNVLDDYDIVTVSNQNYVCSNSFSTYDDCYEYRGGNPANVSTFGTPDLWCGTNSCYEYDPSEWSVVVGNYFCKDRILGFNQYDCYEGFGGNPPTFTGVYPDLYCSGFQASDCSKDWYPDDLADYDFLTYYGSTYICEDAWGGSYGDLDCGRYDGGNPANVWTNDLKCSPAGYSGYDCDRDFYPSEWDGYELVNIGGGTYVCEDTWQGSACYSYYSGSPSSATFGLPDYYCNSWGDCSRDDYP